MQGPGHCGECHSPRNILGGTEQAASLSGGVVQQWLAPNISSDPLDGIGGRLIDDIVKFLRTGADRPMGVAFGPMGEVVHDSLRYATGSDLHEGPALPQCRPAGRCCRGRAPPTARGLSLRSDRQACRPEMTEPRRRGTV